MSTHGDGPLAEVSSNRLSEENRRPIPLPIWTAEKSIPGGTTVLNSTASRDDITARCWDKEDLNVLLAELEDDNEEEEDEEIIEKEVVTLGSARKIPDDYLHTDPRVGLTESEVTRRRRTHGLNQLREEKRSHVKQFLLFFVGPIQFAACILAAALRNWVDLGVIIGLLLLNASVGFIQDSKAGSIVKELQKDLALKCNVRRDGFLQAMNATQLVPGDIVHLEEGVIVPTDGYIITEDAYLEVDQSTITGESLAVRKHQGDTIYQSSAIRLGESFMMVTDIGDNTFVGRSAAMVNAASADKGHFTEVLRGIGMKLLGLVVATLIVVWVSSFYRSTAIKPILEFTLAITVIGVPVGLPAVVTTTMAVGAAFLANKKAIVRNLSAIESLAGVEILCTDKTGTLTKNKLSLAEPYTVNGIEPGELMLAACLAASRKKKGLDAIDKAFWKALTRFPDIKAKLPTFVVLEFKPFDPVSKKVTAVVQSPEGERIVCVKGAPATIIKMVSEADGLAEDTAIDYNDMVTEFARRGFRSLGVARKCGNGPWELLGIMPCSDPPRHDTAKTITEAISLGLKVKMLTGDAVGIARETSRQLGLGENIYNAERFELGEGDSLGDKLFDYVDAADGFAEVFPQHKYSVVNILQQRGYLVAMTGDGVNDAPSLKKADTGIAVEGASDAARSAADLVFLAPGLSAIVDAIKVSRQIFHRMYAYVVYRVALSLHLEIFLGLWIAIRGESLNIKLVLIIAVFADVATLAIAYDRAPFSRSPVKWNLPRMWGISIIMGVILAGGSWICLTTILHGNGKGIIQGSGRKDSVLFLEIALTENWLIFITRTGGQPFWSSWPSWQLFTAVLLLDVLATICCVFGWFDVKTWTKVVSTLATVSRIWVFSIGVFCVMAGVYYLLADAPAFDRLMHCQWPCRSKWRHERHLVELQNYRKSSGVIVAMMVASASRGLTLICGLAAKPLGTV